MTPLGYLRKLEILLGLMRDAIIERQDETENDPVFIAQLDTAAKAMNQAWSELTHADQLMVFNMARHITDTIKPAAPKEPEPPRIQLLN